ncbi:DNA gyrase subunit A [Spiroplasma sp. JKS002669]|uniref:DNA topoisomerase (ATP-hydrolyzing) subunit A n=1 Tax=Spiroplasma attinicola TaxID=2904537 RepID=UPI002023155B|nr:MULTISPECIES: DNA topoisomerase (ATP-hydrolyzing) subunit A [unclassified Spiroplasma]MCL6428831.1 DNA gyrase subunit A [Spiroplasma sp. JKS002669]MCL8210177.1 DNA gyrase subunit A [Spiroplasma sp. JKS002670]
MEDNLKKTEQEALVNEAANISEQVRKDYLWYAVSVITARALPDARDGLKPVHRRILYSMFNLGITHDKPYKKSARIVGEVIGKYHPHGDTAVYESMVRMAQNFSYRYPLIDGHGNFGSIDGDGPAAMRYTESRVSKIASELVKDLDKETVNFIPNFDATEKEPVVLPAYFPNLLANGTMGIAVAMATSIPPHNLNEVIDAITYVSRNRDCDVLELLDIIKGPDFPTGAIILGTSNLRKGYATGRAVIKVRSKTSFEKLNNKKHAIIIEEIPYQVNKTNLINSIVDAVKEKKIEYVTDLRDESDYQGIRIVLELKDESYREVVLNQLYKFTSVQTSFIINLTALDQSVPKTMNLKELIIAYLDHQIVMITNKAIFELKKAERQYHIISGLVKALENIDAVIALIKKAQSTNEAISGLQEKYELSLEQAKAILEMKLQRLTGLEKVKLTQELVALELQIKNLKFLLDNEEEKVKLLIDRLNQIKKNYGDERRTEIITDFDETDIDDESWIKEEPIAIMLSKNNYIKSLPLEVYRTQNRGGVGVKASNSINEEDDIDKLLVASNHSDILFFTSKGKVYRLRAHKIPMFKSKTVKGMPIINLIGIEKDEKIKTVINISEYSDKENLVFITKKGIIKRSSLTHFNSIRSNGKKAINIKPEDELVEVIKTDGNNQLIIAAANGRAVRINETQIRLMSREATGIKGMNVSGSYVIGICSNENANLVLSISEKGFGKISAFEDYRLLNRGSKGVLTMKTNEKTGKLITIKTLNNSYSSTELLMVTLKGLTIRFSLGDIRITGRNTRGVKLIKLKNQEDSIGAVEIITPIADSNINNLDQSRI